MSNKNSNSFINRMLRATQHKWQRVGSWRSEDTYSFILNPIVQTVLWSSALLWGASASLLSDKIMKFTFSWHFSLSNANWYTIGFASSGVALAFGFMLSQWVSRHHDRVIVDSLVTMPPHDFWQIYGDEYTKTALLAANSTINLLDKDLGDDERKTYRNERFYVDIRRVLNIIINLVKKWDASNLRDSKVVYRANIMNVWRYKDTHSPEVWEQLDSLADRFTLKPTVSHYCGFVGMLKNELSTTTGTDDPDADGDCKPIAFPFTVRGNKLASPVDGNLLGAPVAVAEKTTSYVPDVSAIVEHYKKHSSTVDLAITRNLEEYYADTSVAQSILSIPIFPVNELEPRWVLNVYRNQGGLLFDGSKVGDFAQIIKPYTSVLATMMYTAEIYDGL